MNYINFPDLQNFYVDLVTLTNTSLIVFWDQSPVENDADLKTYPAVHQNIESYQRCEGKLKSEMMKQLKCMF